MTPDDPADARTVALPPRELPLHADAQRMALRQPAAATAPVDESDLAGKLPLGTRLAEFEITALIGQGGFGIVYLAHDHSLQRRVALKEYMPSSLAHRVGAGGTQVQVRSERDRDTFEAGLKSFVNEARMLARFDHPALVKVFRFWEGNGTAYMVMPLLEGTTLQAVLRGLPGPPDAAWLRAMLAPLTEALLVMHAEQCYHRDIAPDNVMQLHGSGRWLLLDFGAARRVIGDRTQALTAILKPGYAPVEQYADIPGMKQGPWTDVYALAAVVHAAITGHTPPPSVGRLLTDTYLPLADAAAGRYDRGFLAAIDRALAVRPEQRTQSIGALREDLGLGEPHAVPGSPHAQPLATGAPVVPADPLQRPGLLTGAFEPNRVSAPRVDVVQEPVAKGNSVPVGIATGFAVVAALAIGGYALFVKEPDRVTAGSRPPAAAQPPATVTALDFDISQEFQRVVQAATPGFNVSLQTDKTSYRIGRDELRMAIASDRAGFVHVFVHGADRTLVQLYPSAGAGPLAIGKGQRLTLPEGAEYLMTGEPPGSEELLVLVSAHPRDHGALRPRNEGRVRVFPTGAEAATLLAQRGPAASGAVPPLAGRASCPGGSTACDGAFGAALARVEIVR